MTIGSDSWAGAGDIPIPYTGGLWSENYGSNSALTVEAGEPAPTSFSSGKSLWYKFTPNQNGKVYIDTLGSGDTEIAVYTGSSLAGLTKIASDSDSLGSGAGFASRISNLSVTSGTTYYLQIRAFNSNTMTYVTRFGWVDTSNANDLIANARSVSIPTNGATYTDRFTDNASAAMESSEPLPVAANTTTGRSMWWKYTPSSSGSAQFDTIGTLVTTGTTDTQLAVYTGGPTIAGLTKVASDDDTGGSGTSKATFSVTGGVTYWIQVGSQNGGGMAYRLNVTGPASAVAYTGDASRSLTISAAAAAALGIHVSASRSLTVAATSTATRGKRGDATPSLAVAATSTLARGVSAPASAPALVISTAAAAALGLTADASQALAIGTSSAMGRGKVAAAAPVLSIVATSDADVVHHGPTIRLADGTTLGNIRYADGSKTLTVKGWLDDDGVTIHPFA